MNDPSLCCVRERFEFPNAYLETDIPIAGVAHQAGTCRFGTDPRSSVLDVNCRAPEGRKQPTLHPAPHRPTRVENEYFREGAWVYLAAWDVHRAKVFGRCESQNGIAPVARLPGEVMSQEPYQSAGRVFRIMDNCSAQRGRKAVDASPPNGGSS